MKKGGLALLLMTVSVPVWALSCVPPPLVPVVHTQQLSAQSVIWVNQTHWQDKAPLSVVGLSLIHI